MQCHIGADHNELDGSCFPMGSSLHGIDADEAGVPVCDCRFSRDRGGTAADEFVVTPLVSRVAQVWDVTRGVLSRDLHVYCDDAPLFGSVSNDSLMDTWTMASASGKIYR